MPHKSRPHCAIPRCPNYAVIGSAYCVEHRRERSRRDPSYRKLYNRKWEKISKLYLLKNPLCAECQRNGRLTPATETHHVKPLSAGGTHAESNLMGLCKSCHSKLHGGITGGDSS
ncbi:MAG: HNH endonuclease [Oscillospiraceae bacterium]|nr:HNH endonuclease [Oscillospiraceae bacterium]